jgi:nicotinate-nucleotide adenylyltransferase
MAYARNLGRFSLAVRKKIGIFGGTFNPVHIGHLRSAEEVKERLRLDRILFVPSFNPPLKDSSLAPFSDRLKMVRLATKGNPDFSVSDIESRIRGKSYTVYALKAMKKEFPGTHMYFIMGTDAFIELANWYKPLEILESVDIVVIHRPSIDMIAVAGSPFLSRSDCRKLAREGLQDKMIMRPVSGKGRITFLPTTHLDISATEIRNMIRKSLSVKYLLPQNVESFIISHNLYSRMSGKES